MQTASLTAAAVGVQGRRLWKGARMERMGLGTASNMARSWALF